MHCVDFTKQQTLFFFFLIRQDFIVASQAGSLFCRPWPHYEVVQWLNNSSKWRRKVRWRRGSITAAGGNGWKRQSGARALQFRAASLRRQEVVVGLIFFPFLRILKLKEEVFTAGWAEFSSVRRELRAQTMDIYQEAVDYLQSHHVPGEKKQCYFISALDDLTYMQKLLSFIYFLCLVIR